MPQRTPGAAPRGRPWSGDDNEELVALALNGHDSNDIAARMGRTPQAIHTRAHLAAGCETSHVSGPACVQALRERLESDPTYNWAANLPQPRANSRKGRARRHWTPAQDAALAHAWRNKQPRLDVIADTLDVTPETVADRIVELGLCSSTTLAMIKMGSPSPPRIPATIDFLRSHGINPDSIDEASSPHANPWRESDYELLVEALRAGIGYEGAALAVNRPLKSVRSQAKALIWVGRGSGGADDYLTVETLLRDDPAYQWRGHVKAYHYETGVTYWTREATADVERAWQSQDASLTELAATHHLLEEAIARHLISEGFANTLQEVADRLRYAETGSFAKLLRWNDARTLHAAVTTTSSGAVVSIEAYGDAASAQHAADAARATLAPGHMCSYAQISYPRH